MDTLRLSLLSISVVVFTSLGSVGCLGADASAADQIRSVKDQLRLPDLTDLHFSTDYPGQLADHLTGRWVVINDEDMSQSAGDKSLQDACDARAVRINASDPFDIRLTQQPDTDQELEIDLVSLGGLLYQMQTSVSTLEKVNHFNPAEQSHRDGLLSTMQKISGRAMLLRPAVDVFLIQMADVQLGVFAKPQILARC